MKIDDRGAVWRRWDLHVHTPESALANQFKSWDDYLTAVETAGADVSVVGFTDYCSIEGYKRAIDYRNLNRLQRFDLIIPNIEFRIQTLTAEGRAVNLHILVDPSAPDHIAQIEDALGHLTFEYNKVHYRCTTEQLRALGRALKPEEVGDAVEFRNGVNNFKPSFDAIKSWLEGKGRWLSENGLVVVANDSKDGASGLAKDSGMLASRQEIYRSADLIFSATPSDRIYFLGKGVDSPEEVVRKIGALKACIHGSDAHETGKLFEPDQQRYCWIKADPSFEGLRQLLHEPEDRVSIGPTPPAAVDASKVIDSISFKGGAHWFEATQIDLNPGLVAIIGEKGSGKTALAELIAYACSAEPGPKSSSSFVQKADFLAKDIGIEITWQDGKRTSRKIGATRPDDSPRVRYLSQDFVEELCSQDLKGAQLVREIEDVVFSYIPESERLGAANFDGLRRLKTEHIERRKTAIKERLSTANREIVDLENQYGGRGAKRSLIAKITSDILAIDQQLPALQTTVDQQVASELGTLGALHAQKSSELAQLNRRISRLSTVREKAVDFEKLIQREYNALFALLVDAGFTAPEADAYRPVMTADRAKPFDRLIVDAQKAARDLRGDPDKPNPTGETLVDLEFRQASLKERLATDAQHRERLVALQEQKVRLEADKARHETELKRLDTTVKATLDGKRQDRWTDYLGYFELLKEEQIALAALYTPLTEVIAEDPTGTKSGFELNVNMVADADQWLQRGLALFDKRKAIPLMDDAVQSKLPSTLFEAWKEGDGGGVRSALADLQANFGTPQQLDELLVTHTDRKRAYDWLYSTEHVRLAYGLRYMGSDLEVLSPGTRGIVLLVLYLAMDRQDRRPLIIDQPEGNLDNSSVYEALVPFLRKAKKARQVILVSHNPNLVITTDADQVIVAKAIREPGQKHPRIRYSAGAIENAGTDEAIRDQAVRLLEGGSRPFKTREHRYALP